MLENTVNEWLSSFAATAIAADLEAHMSHISKSVQVYGIPGFESVGYDDWHRQCSEEFPQKLIKELSYDDITFSGGPDETIMIKARERLETSEGKTQKHSVEMLLDKSEGPWLLKELRVLPEQQG